MLHLYVFLCTSDFPLQYQIMLGPFGRHLKWGFRLPCVLSAHRAHTSYSVAYVSGRQMLPSGEQFMAPLAIRLILLVKWCVSCIRQVQMGHWSFPMCFHIHLRLVLLPRFLALACLAHSIHFQGHLWFNRPRKLHVVANIDCQLDGI